MNEKRELKRSVIQLTDSTDYSANDNREWRLLRRIIISGLISLILFVIVYYTLPTTILTTSSLIEYSTIVALVIFLFVLLLRYFGILVSSYFYFSEYTFKPTNGFQPFVSIIVPVFNEERIIERSINSLLELNYANYEIIIVNDGSTDNTKQIAES